MFDFWNAIKKHRFEEEIKKIEDEISRSKRFNYSFGVFVVDISHKPVIKPELFIKYADIIHYFQ